MDVYTNRDNYHPKYNTILLNKDSSLPVKLPPDYWLVNVSTNGRHCLLAPVCSEAKEQGMYVFL
jgi:proteasome lid subunit RPN8/RPN11